MIQARCYPSKSLRMFPGKLAQHNASLKALLFLRQNNSDHHLNVTDSFHSFLRMLAAHREGGHRQRIKTQKEWIIIICDNKTDVQECSITAGKYPTQIVIVIIRYRHPKFNIIDLRQNTITNTATRPLLDQRCSAWFTT